MSMLTSNYIDQLSR